jgi:outer membrane protein assembly factor BamC
MINLKFAVTLVSVSVLSACALVEGDKVDYGSVAKTPDLSVPPDLTQLTRDTRFVPPSASVSASALQAAARPSMTISNAIAANSIGDIRIERAGNKRWLVVDRPAQALWEPTQEFWKGLGLKLNLDDRQLGFMETDWAQNRALVPTDPVGNFFKKAFGSLNDTGTRDRYRTRFEAVSANSTEIYISHRSVVEIAAVGALGNTIDSVWREGPTNPDLELEMLRRLMLQLGLKPKEAQALVDNSLSKDNASAEGNKNSSLIDSAEGPLLRINDGFDRAWRRLGLALDRTGFTVEDRDRAQGTYFVRYVDVLASKEEPGFWARLGGAKAVVPVKYRVSLRADGAVSNVRLLTDAGQAEDKAKAKPILELLAKELQ